MKKWTLMFYLAGDNNLSDDMAASLAAISEFSDKLRDIAVTVFYDSSAIGVPTRYFDIGSGTSVETDESSAKPGAIRKFVEWTVRKQGHVAENYGLVLSGHGDGYFADTFLRDDDPGGSVSVWQLGRSLSAITANRKRSKQFTLGQKFALVGFDACVTNTIEVAVEIGGAANFMVGSQGLISNRGWDYRLLFETLTADGADLSEDGVACAMANAFIEASLRSGKYCGRSADASVVDLRGGNVDLIARKVNRLGKKLRRGLTDRATSEAFARVLLETHYFCQTLIFDQAVDLSDFAGCLSAVAGETVTFCRRIVEAAPDSEIGAEAARTVAKLAAVTELADDLRESAMRCAATVSIGPETYWCGGLSLFFPWSFHSYLVSRNRYLNYSFARSRNDSKPAGWVGFLDAYLSSTMRIPLADGAPDATVKAGMVQSTPAKLVPPTTKFVPPTTKLVPPTTKLVPPTTKFVPPTTKLVPPTTKFVPPTTKFVPPTTKFVPPTTKLNPSGVTSNSIEVFRRFKNSAWLPGTEESK